MPSSGEDEKENNGKGNDKNVPHGNKKTKELLAEEQEVSAEASEAQVQTFSSNSGIPVDLALLEDVMLLPTGANKTNIESFDLTGYINDVNRQYTQVLMEYGKNGKYTSIYSYGLQRLGADYNGAQTVYLYDGRGSMVHETNGSGTSMSSYLYDEWGNLLSGKVHTNGFYSDLFLYNGEATDITTGLQYLRARYYDPEMGRFIQQDSFLGYIQTPLSLNLYIYVRNNPLNYMDPSGNLGDFVDRRVIPGKEDMTWYEQFQERIRMNQRDNSIYSINKIDDQLLDLSLAYSRTEPGVERLKLRVQMDDLRAKRSSYCGDFFEVAKTTEYGALPPNFFKDLNKLTYLQELLLDSRAKGNKTQLLNALSQSMRQASTQDEYNALLNAYNYILQDRTTFSPVETSVSVGIYMEDLSFTEDTREATTTAAELVNSIYPSVPGTLFVIGQHLSAEDWDAVRDDLWGVAGDKLLDSTVASQFGPLLPILGTGIAFAILS